MHLHIAAYIFPNFLPQCNLLTETYTFLRNLHFPFYMHLLMLKRQCVM